MALHCEHNSAKFLFFFLKEKKKLFCCFFSQQEFFSLQWRFYTRCRFIIVCYRLRFGSGWRNDRDLLCPAAFVVVTGVKDDALCSAFVYEATFQTAFLVYWKKWTVDWFFFFIIQLLMLGCTSPQPQTIWTVCHSASVHVHSSLSRCFATVHFFRRSVPPIWNVSPLPSCRIEETTAVWLPDVRMDEAAVFSPVSRQRNLHRPPLAYVSHACCV